MLFQVNGLIAAFFVSWRQPVSQDSVIGWNTQGTERVGELKGGPCVHMYIMRGEYCVGCEVSSSWKPWQCMLSRILPEHWPLLSPGGEQYPRNTIQCLLELVVWAPGYCCGITSGQCLQPNHLQLLYQYLSISRSKSEDDGCCSIHFHLELKEYMLACSSTWKANIKGYINNK